jgi:methyl-accepting chemotaxis protein
MKKNMVIFGIISIVAVAILNGLILSVDAFIDNPIYGSLLGAAEGAVLAGLTYFLLGKTENKQESELNFLEDILNNNVKKLDSYDEEAVKKYSKYLNVNEESNKIDLLAQEISADKVFLLEKAEDLSNLIRNFEEKMSDQNDVYRKIIANIEKTTGEVQEITSAANIAAETSLKTLELTSSTVELATSGVENVESSLIKMGEIKENTDTTSDSVIKLEEKANEIGGIIVSITKISEQTNLLALNAAIEAARAGEAGKGFAVVAQEIRGLADESRKAAENINNIVAVIQSQTKQAVDKMSKTSEVVQEGSESSSSVGESLTIMLDSISKINNMMQDVAAGAQQQSANTHEIAKQMDINAGFINDELGNIEKLQNYISEEIEIIDEMRNRIRQTEDLIDKLQASNEKRLKVKE